MSWNLLDIDNFKPAQKQQGPRSEVDYFNLTPRQRLALSQLYRPARPFTPKSDLQDLSCAPCQQRGLGFLPGNGDGGGGLDFNLDEWLPTFDWSWLFPNPEPDYGGGGGGGGGGLILQNDDCGRPPAHISYGCPCGSMWSGDPLIGCINPCEEGWQVEWRTVRDAQGNISYIEECKPTATQPPTLVCPQGTVKNGAYCIDPGNGTPRQPVNPRGGSGSGGGGGTGGGGTTRTTPGVSRLPGNDQAQALAQAQALCQRVGKQYDPQQRKCVGGIQQQQPFGVLQSTVGGVPVWAWAVGLGVAVLVLKRI